MAAYEWKIGGIHKADANVAGEVCEALARSEEGLSPETLLAASRNEEAPLHGEFEWNDETAAEKYRLGQARKIIVDLTCTTTVSGGDVCERAYVNVRPNPSGA